MLGILTLFIGTVFGNNGLTLFGKGIDDVVGFFI